MIRGRTLCQKEKRLSLELQRVFYCISCQCREYCSTSYIQYYILSVATESNLFCKMFFLGWGGDGGVVVEEWLWDGCRGMVVVGGEVVVKWWWECGGGVGVG